MKLFDGIRRMLANSQRERLDEQLEILATSSHPEDGEAARYLRIAQEWRADGKVDASWVALHRARQAEVDSMTADQVQSLARELTEELRSGKVTGWRQTAASEKVTAALQLLLPHSTPDQVNAAQHLRAARAQLREALRIRDEHFDNTYRHLAISRQYRHWLILLAVLMLIAAVVLMSVIGAASLDPNPASGDPFSGNWLLALAIVFGTLGALSSALQRLARDPFVGRIPEHLGVLSIISTRPLIGAIAGLTAYISVQAGITVLQDHPVPGMLAAAFAAGFTERLAVLSPGETDPNPPPGDTRPLSAERNR